MNEPEDTKERREELMGIIRWGLGLAAMACWSVLVGAVGFGLAIMGFVTSVSIGHSPANLPHSQAASALATRALLTGLALALAPWVIVFGVLGIRWWRSRRSEAPQASELESSRAEPTTPKAESRDNTPRIWVVLTNAVSGAIALWVGTFLLVMRTPPSSKYDITTLADLPIFGCPTILLSGALLGTLAGLLVFAAGRLARFSQERRETAKVYGCLVALLPGLIAGVAPTLFGMEPYDRFLGVVFDLLDRSSPSVHEVAFSPDGGRIATFSEFDLHIWEAENGEKVLEVESVSTVYNTGSASVAFSPDGGQIAVLIERGRVGVFDAQTGHGVRHPFGTGEGYCSSVAFSPDGGRIVTSSHDGMIRTWDVESRTQLIALSGHADDWVESAIFSPDGSRIVTASTDKTARIWDAETGEELLVLTGHTGGVATATFGPDGSRVVTGSSDDTARIWDAETGEELLTLTGHSGPVFYVGLSPDGSRIVTGSADGTVRIWDAETGTELRTLRGDFLSVALSPAGSRIVTGGWDGRARIWDAETGEEILVIRVPGH